MLIINVNKPFKWTSFDVVKFLKKHLKENKVGHLGTLDPLATGVLPIFTGKATKLISFLNHLSKTYVTILKLGECTDTFDAEGVVLETKDFAHLREEQVHSVVSNYLGKQIQMTPIYSAVKLNGIPSYRLARQGQEVPRKEREIQIESIVVQKIDFPLVQLEVRCSAGTYIRTLVDDIGRELGTGAHVVALQRTACGSQFELEDACNLGEYKRGFQYDEDSLAQLKKKIALATIHPVSLLKYMDTVHVDKERYHQLKNGQPLRVERSEISEPQITEALSERLTKAVDCENHLIAVGRLAKTNQGYQFYPSKIFV